MVPSSLVKGELTFEFVRPPDRRHTFRSRLIEASPERLIVAHTAYPSKPLKYGSEEVMAAGYEAVWFLFKDEPFDVGRFYRPDGTWTGYYADVLEPVRWEGAAAETLEPIVDLFLDLWVAPDGGFVVLDEDELDAALAEGHVTEAQARSACETLEQLITRTQQGQFPPQVVKDFRR